MNKCGHKINFGRSWGIRRPQEKAELKPAGPLSQLAGDPGLVVVFSWSVFSLSAFSGMHFPNIYFRKCTFQKCIFQKYIFHRPFVLACWWPWFCGCIFWKCIFLKCIFCEFIFLNYIFESVFSYSLLSKSVFSTSVFSTGPLSQLADDPGFSVGGRWLMIGEELRQLQNLQNQPTLPKSEHHRHRHLLKFSSYRNTRHHYLNPSIRGTQGV